MAESQTAFQLLLEIDQRCRLLAADLPSQEARQDTWSGIGFRLGEQWYVAPMGEVAEVLHEPRYTLLPGVKPWVRGVANLRGRLLPIMDLCGFFGHELSVLRKQRRVLVLEYKEVFAGLLVDEVAGMQHFPQGSRQMHSVERPELVVAPFVQGCFERGRSWWVFSPFVLAQAPGFLDVAV
ncbi:chemotaxis protein CheW [Pseudomonas gingeri]|uniref:chemotaxis protein CheW n=1 Tax=Pseudomonas gingeri TaxID=117681 RepID=UPI0015A22EE1|nr:chemotaxis protein CheW [Pseudomonas gingeri]NWA01105.1 purine-binding chemotaxis protein CheW [Pseudomonas gingeri]NWA15330.1 purine-binding chemotaxis protein CheW [Pseudomonas gingeri]NWA53537.1 purine-binding chemotaxis protein CheW [Pseudomonas gingeri]NWA99202.1 purine-binding chemotaxis protein CheW [Pseudomonas gingeri]NWB03958.1 purine-binding chemotaxis protein CheW [Pseudomonas gingeri]